MSQRTYNIFFHLHTISGIVISAGLYIIFFAGAFTLFIAPIENWEKEITREVTNTKKGIGLDYNRLIDSLSVKHELYGRNLYVSEDMESTYPYVYLSGSEYSKANPVAKEGLQLQLNTSTYEIKPKDGNFFGLADLFYDLHFYYQLGEWGYYASGFVALFFLFALITGVIIHWKKVKPNFFLFRPREKFKTVWTDAHTTLGVIGIPFQFMYALTGAMFSLSIIVSLTAAILYGGDRQQYYALMYPEPKITLGEPVDGLKPDYNGYIKKATARWQGFTAGAVNISQLASTTARIKVSGAVGSKSRFINEGGIEFDVLSGRITHQDSPFEKGYEDIVWPSAYSLHYADFNGLGILSHYVVKLLYFLLALITCFIIISGILIWVTAREKKAITDKQRRFNRGVSHGYLAICLSMFPVTALSFIVSGLIPESFDAWRHFIINTVFFGSWLVLSVYFWFHKSNEFTNRYTLLTGGILALSIPLVSGFGAGKWFWITFAGGFYDVFFIDMLWLSLALAALVAYRKITKRFKVLV